MRLFRTSINWGRLLLMLPARVMSRGSCRRTQAAGVAGQGNGTPASLFNNHQMLKITNALGTTYYDPSYGVTYTSAADFDSKAIAGYFYIGQKVVNGNRAVGLFIENKFRLETR